MVMLRAGIASLSTGSAILKVMLHKVHSVNSNHINMIESNAGSGQVNNLKFNDVVGRESVYSLDVDQNWVEGPAAR
jgi:rhamnogalacturonan hydrolase